MKKVLVIQHVPHEGLGIIGPMLESAGIGADCIKVYKDKLPRDAQGYDGLIVLGGPMGVYEEDTYPFISKEIKLIQSALKDRLPILGICLGSQLLAKAAGASVYKGNAKEIGWFNISLTEEGKKDRLLMGLPGELTVFQWHGDTFDVPSNGVNLVSSELFPNQLIKVGPCAYGVQFHLEVTERMVDEWTEVNEDELKPLGIDGDEIIEETETRIYDLHKYGRTFISRFLRLLQ
ncbi:MAG: gamma-glutamyl-gamma-aminobutyrate hydrolase family protein [Deltaproteobacteria bacterium]|nr:gamma-glutamyl-gamma-aminobutyrate hydrolase family protein [Deltaproteobacteria bacterium]